MEKHFINGWLCRDSAETLWLFEGDYPPYKDNFGDYRTEDKFGFTYINDKLYPDITWQSLPRPITIDVYSGKPESVLEDAVVLSGYITRDYNEKLHLFICSAKPQRSNFYWESGDEDELDWPMELYQNMFPDVLWETEEPLPVTVVITDRDADIKN